MKRDNTFALRIAVLSAVGYGLTVTAVTFVDARTPSHVRYGAREYPYGYTISLLALPVFAITFLALRRDITRGWRCFASCFPLVVAVIVSLWVFKPEFPHAGLLGWSSIYVVTSLLATWLRYSGPDLSFARDRDIPVPARVEGLKTMVSVWQTIAIATCAGFLAGFVPWAASIFSADSHVVTEERDLFFLNSMGLMQMVAAGIAFLLGPIREVVLRVLAITAEFASIRGDDCQGTVGRAGVLGLAKPESSHLPNPGPQADG